MQNGDLEEHFIEILSELRVHERGSFTEVDSPGTLDPRRPRSCRLGPRDPRVLARLAPILRFSQSTSDKLARPVRLSRHPETLFPEKDSLCPETQTQISEIPPRPQTPRTEAPGPGLDHSNEELSGVGSGLPSGRPEGQVAGAGSTRSQSGLAQVGFVVFESGSPAQICGARLGCTIAGDAE